jgi:hypothetical protein
MTLEYKRIVNLRPGFDCPANNCPSCKAGRVGSHGRASDEWFFTVVRADAALTLNVLTPFYPETAMFRDVHKHYYTLHTCLAWPSDVSTIAAGRGPKMDCEYIGSCYQGSEVGSGLRNEFVSKHFVEAARLEQPDSFWSALHQLLLHLMDEAAPFRVMRRCEHCQGTGVKET